MYKLVIADEEGSTSTVPIIRDEITIGRKEGNTIRLTERDVSREHARVLREDGRIFVEDVNARYGVKKNGVKIKQREEFSPGDVISIGAYSLTLKSKKPATKAPPMPAQKPGKPPLRDEKTQVIPAMPAKLVVISSNFAGQEFPLNRPEMIIGRGEDCDIIIDHRSVSQRHAKVIRENGNHYQIVDLKSKNGVTVGGEQYRAVQVKRGDVVELGHVKFRFVAPGENYVFTPQPANELVEHDFDLPAQSSSKMPLIALIIVLLVGAGAAAVIFGNSDKPANDPSAALAAPADPLAQAEQPGAPAEAGAETSKVAQAIQEASEDIRTGKIDKALGSLESAKKFLDPTPDEQNAIAELMGNAKNEKPFAKHYSTAKERLKASAYADALEQLSKIPQHSIFAKISEDEGLRNDALAGIVSSAEKALEDGDAQKARTLAERALAEEDDYPAAVALLEKLDAKPVEVAAKTAPKASPSSTKSRPSKPAAKPKSSNRVSAAEAKELYVSAQGKIFKNDTSGAIADCKKALRGGNSGCYRILAIAYKQQGNTSAACNNFKRFLGTKPKNPAAIQRQMDELGCN
ncbi:FHA domain-containing protein [Bradymonas sediminis]|uniref:Uncharacterized protein n=1 Tax=Bradymonas sediminis TaxID=1548548 RepID=A0A2Z4FP16_9DELT|nr:FHA domain-containing protein [Bradymonas sediminis]AWV90747.1 hypothetical protein DN745_16065 [Bradymonas sediminis]TDP62610.1 pSer/pThr/pTyr-binding forkhead associated (FHA) protein [Bradymonas sediminis]